MSAKFSGANGKEVVIRVERILVKKYAEVPWEKCEEYADEVIRKSCGVNGSSNSNHYFFFHALSQQCMILMETDNLIVKIYV